MAILKIPALTIKKIIILLFLVIITFFLGLLGKLIANKSLTSATSAAQAQNCWIPPGEGSCGEGGSSTCEATSGGEGGEGGY